MVRDGKLGPSIEYYYIQNEIEMVKFHVDDHEEFQSACQSIPFGGNVLVRKPLDQKKRMMFSQDEVIF